MHAATSAIVGPWFPRADRATQGAAADMEKAEQVLGYMVRPKIADCLSLWFGKSLQTDEEIRVRFGADVVRASLGFLDHWALDTERPRRLVALVILLDQFPRNVYRNTPRMYASDARCRVLVQRALAAGVGRRLRPIERVFLCLALTHSEALDDQRLCMQEWGRATAGLAPDDPLLAFNEIFQRHLAVVQRFGRFPHRNGVLGRASTGVEERFLEQSTYRFDLPLVVCQGGRLSFSGTCGRA